MGGRAIAVCGVLMGRIRMAVPVRPVLMRHVVVGVPVRPVTVVVAVRSVAVGIEMLVAVEILSRNTMLIVVGIIMG